MEGGGGGGLHTPQQERPLLVVLDEEGELEEAEGVEEHKGESGGPASSSLAALKQEEPGLQGATTALSASPRLSRPPSRSSLLQLPRGPAATTTLRGPDAQPPAKEAKPRLETNGVATGGAPPAECPFCFAHFPQSQVQQHVEEQHLRPAEEQEKAAASSSSSGRSFSGAAVGAAVPQVLRCPLCNEGFDSSERLQVHVEQEMDAKEAAEGATKKEEAGEQTKSRGNNKRKLARRNSAREMGTLEFAASSSSRSSSSSSSCSSSSSSSLPFPSKHESSLVVDLVDDEEEEEGTASVKEEVAPPSKRRRLQRRSAATVAARRIRQSNNFGDEEEQDLLESLLHEEGEVKTEQIQNGNGHETKTTMRPSVAQEEDAEQGQGHEEGEEDYSDVTFNFTSLFDRPAPTLDYLNQFTQTSKTKKNTPVMPREWQPGPGSKSRNTGWGTRGGSGGSGGWTKSYNRNSGNKARFWRRRASTGSTTSRSNKSGGVKKEKKATTVKRETVKREKVKREKVKREK
ncbi:hypothetical protein QOT17_016975 [Balamuthia mandrillaris]